VGVGEKGVEKLRGFRGVVCLVRGGQGRRTECTCEGRRGGGHCGRRERGWRGMVRDGIPKEGMHKGRRLKRGLGVSVRIPVAMRSQIARVCAFGYRSMLCQDAYG
jgi:hypothetical protein